MKNGCYISGRRKRFFSSLTYPDRLRGLTSFLGKGHGQVYPLSQGVEARSSPLNTVSYPGVKMHAASPQNIRWRYSLSRTVKTAHLFYLLNCQALELSIQHISAVIAKKVCRQNLMSLRTESIVSSLKNHKVSEAESASVS